LCVANILTGRFWQNLIPFEEFLRRAYLGESIPRMLKDRGFRVELFPKFSTRSILIDGRVMSNVYPEDSIPGFSESLQISGYLLDLTVFRYAPHILKKSVYNDRSWRLSCRLKPRKRSHLLDLDLDHEFFQNLRDEFTTGVEAPVFKYIHLFGAHPPYHVFGGRTRKTPNGFSRNAYLHKMAYKLEGLAGTFKFYREQGIYDRSLIIVVGDHGAGRQNRIPIDTALIGHEKITRQDLKYPTGLRSRAVPVFMVKRFGAQGPMRISPSAVSSVDIRNIIFEELGLNVTPAENIGIDGEIFDGKNRRHLVLTGTAGNELYGALHEYTIQGHAWLESSWRGPQHLFCVDGVMSRVTQITFGQAGNYKNYAPAGWGKDETVVTRLGKSISTLLLEEIEPGTDLEIRVHHSIPSEPCDLGVYFDKEKILEFKTGTEAPGIEGNYRIAGEKIRNDTFRLGIKIEAPGALKEGPGIRSIMLWQKMNKRDQRSHSPY
jgi:hypothetical protein